MRRLKKLQESMVGGERVNDKELQERRLRKKRAAERRLNALARALVNVETEEGPNLVLGVYDDIQEELRAKNEGLKKYKQKVGLGWELYRNVFWVYAKFLKFSPSPIKNVSFSKQSNKWILNYTYYDFQSRYLNLWTFESVTNKLYIYINYIFKISINVYFTSIINFSCICGSQ